MDNRELGLTLGADDYFLKPIDGEAFLQRIRELVPAAGAHGSRLLLVDDDPKLHDLLESLLAPCGYQLEHAYSGREGLAKAEEGDFDLVVLDLLMEGMDGFEVAGAFKGRATTASVPILVLTAKDLTLEEHRRLLDKVNALVQKGTASPAALVKAIRDLLARHPRRS